MKMTTVDVSFDGDDKCENKVIDAMYIKGKFFGNFPIERQKQKIQLVTD